MQDETRSGVAGLHFDADAHSRPHVPRSVVGGVFLRVDVKRR